MSERALRGTRLVVTSYETDRGIDLAPRQAVEYACEKGHRFEMPFSVEAEIPPEWECKVCGAQALLVDGDGPEEKKAKPARTHWDMLMERRTREELEEVLEERLAVLRSGAMNIAVHPGTAESRLDPGGDRNHDAQWYRTAGAVLPSTAPAVLSAFPGRPERPDPPQRVSGGRGPSGVWSPEPLPGSSRMTSPWTTLPSGRWIRACWKASPRGPRVASRSLRSKVRSA